MDSASTLSRPGTVGIPETIHLFHHTLARGGGMERYAATLADGFRELGHKVVFHARRLDYRQAAAWHVEPVSIRICNFPRKLRDYRFYRAVQKQLATNALDGIQVALWRVPVRDLMICSGTHRGYLRQAGRRMGFFDWLQVWIEQKAYDSARFVISHSPLCSGELRDLYHVPEGRILMTYMPIEANFAPPAAPQTRVFARRKLSLPEDKVVFLFPSTGHSRKGLKPICEALKPLGSEVVLAVAGKAPKGQNAPYVHYLGYVDDMVAAYHAADFAILGSNYEPFGLVGPESLLCGTRIVFEQRIGCLAAINPAYVTTFSVDDLQTIRDAARSSIDLARKGLHHISNPVDALTYDTSPISHARELVRVATQSSRASTARS